MQNNILTLSWSVSRGQNTAGWNICRLDDKQTGKRYRTCGGGYDMTGTVIGEWLTDRYQDRLQAIGDRASSYYSKAGGYKTHRVPGSSMPFGDIDRAYYYGMTRNDDTGRVGLDGACGVETMLRIAEAIGLRVTRTSDPKGRTVGFTVIDSGLPPVQVAA
jgi:hypothetical protein